MQENYCKVLQIEALTMIDMVRRNILPAVSKCTRELASAIVAKERIGVAVDYERETAAEISALTAELFKQVKILENAVHVPATIKNPEARSLYYKDSILPVMRAIRIAGDRLETVTPAADWPFPTYGELLFGVR